MRQVHQVVDHQHVVALDVHDLLAIGPFRRVVVPGVGDDFALVGERGIAHPDPDDAVLLDHRIGTHLRHRRNVGLTGNFDALAGAVEDEPMIAALEAIFDNLAVAERSGAMAAAILERGGLARGVAEQHQSLVHDGAGENAVFDLIRPARDVPSVADERFDCRVFHHGDLPQFYLGEASAVARRRQSSFGPTKNARAGGAGVREIRETAGAQALERAGVGRRGGLSRRRSR